MDQDLIYRIPMFILLVAGFSISGYYRRKAGRTGGDEIDFSRENPRYLRFRSLVALVSYGGMLLYLIYPPAMNWSQLENPAPTLRWAGVGIMALMVPVIYWLFSSIGNNISPTVITRREHKLVTSGPYRWMRHPLYTFGTLNFIGFSLAAANWFIFAGVALGFAAIALRTPLEEQNLIERFGDEYREYMARTGRYLPKLGGN